MQNRAEEQQGPQTEDNLSVNLTSRNAKIRMAIGEYANDKSTENLQKVKDMAVDRAKFLYDKIRSNPDLILDNHLTNEELTSLPEDVRNIYFEKNFSNLRGEITAEISENFESGQGDSTLVIKPESEDKSYETVIVGDKPQLNASTPITIKEGITFGDYLITRSGENISLGEPETTKVTGKLKIGVIPFYFSNSPDVVYPSKKLEEDLFSVKNPDSLPNYFNKASYGNMTVTGKVFDWISIDESQKTVSVLDLFTPCPFRIWGEKAENFLTNSEQSFNLNDYDRIIYVFPQRIQCTNKNIAGQNIIWGGTTFIGGNKIWINGSKISNSIYTHEIVHTLGLGHADALFCPNASLSENCRLNHLGDPFDLMSYAYSEETGDMNAFFKEKLGWLPEIPEINENNISKTGVYFISPLENNPTESLLQTLKIRIPGTSEYYYVEYRQPFSSKQQTLLSQTGLTFPGVIQIRTTDYTPASDNPKSTAILDLHPQTPDYFKDAFLTRADPSFFDILHNISIIQIGKSNNMATVQISFSKNPPPTPTPGAWKPASIIVSIPKISQLPKDKMSIVTLLWCKADNSNDCLFDGDNFVVTNPYADLLDGYSFRTVPPDNNHELVRAYFVQIEKGYKKEYKSSLTFPNERTVLIIDAKN